MRAALISLFLFAGGMAAAQETAPPVVSTEAPEQSGAPAAAGDTADLPMLHTGQAEPQTVAPASGAADAPVAPQTADPSADPSVSGTLPSNDAGAPSLAAGETPALATEAAPAAASESGAGNATPLQAAPGAAIPGSAGVEAAGNGAAVPAPLSAHSVKLDSLFWDAHWIVQAVMVGLAIAAFAALVILIHKTVEFALAFGSMRRTAKQLSAASDLHAVAAALSGRKGPSADIIRAAAEELRLAEIEPVLIPGVRERTAAATLRIEAGAAQKLRSGTGMLASIGSLSPFVGLFGTVFGIMNSFIAIAETKTTNLAVVAPGIAEALLATAIGLAAAIPAVLIFNICTRRLAKYRHRLSDISAAAARLQSRALDRLAAATMGG